VTRPGSSQRRTCRPAPSAARTVYVHFPTKADLLRRCIGVAIGGDTADVRLVDRDWMRDAMTAPTRRERIRLMAAVTAGLMERAGPLLRVAQQAEATEPDIAAAAVAGRNDTRRNLKAFWRGMADDGLLPANCDLEWLTETATLLVYPDTYLLLQNTASWDAAAYEAWLMTTWTRLAQAAKA
jgi:AcrR family transcriptional regulator